MKRGDRRRRRTVGRIKRGDKGMAANPSGPIASGHMSGTSAQDRLCAHFPRDARTASEAFFSRVVGSRAEATRRRPPRFLLSLLPPTLAGSRF